VPRFLKHVIPRFKEDPVVQHLLYVSAIGSQCWLS
jgi:hypothetical protein